ncbi:MAG: DUF1669 domain-containing protein [Chryseobacterium sp.]|nr:DUF1669 domain-containing protein [Chryseobacterium sp.]
MDNLVIQDTIDDSEKILERIKAELQRAESEILVAMAWFTNVELYSIIENKLEKNIKVSIILSEQPDNEKLDFDNLIRKGAQLERIKNVGWGMMHQKFCIIDRNIAISGSYNWSNNAKNNHENVIVTSFPKTVNELVDTFFKIQNRAKKINDGYSIEDLKREEENKISEIDESLNKVKQKDKISFQEQSFHEFKDVLDHIIATEVGSFDKELLKENAYKRALENNGDHQVLPQAMDSLYSNFINEIEVIQDKKSRLKNKIEEQLKISISNVELKTENEVNNLNLNLILESKNIENDIKTTQRQVDEKKSIITTNKDVKLPFLENKVEVLKKNIGTLRLEFVKPPINWPMSLLLGFLTIILFSYIFVFYSSVAYIFMFSKEDTLTQIATGVVTETAEVFNAHAITKIWDKGAGGIMFLFLFVGIPVALGLVDLIKNDHTELSDHVNNTGKSKNLYRILGLLGILLVDGFMAYKVSKNINEIDYLTNKTDVRLQTMDVIYTESFWLVFILGSLGVFLFGLVVESLFNRFNKRNATFQQEKTKYLVQQDQNEINDLEIQINVYKEENSRIDAEVSILEKDKESQNTELQNIPINTNNRINFLQQQLLSFKEKVENLAQIYRSQIDNDRLPLSRAEMENRVNIFMEGWSKFLYDKYSISIAESKTTEAIHQCETWLQSLSIHTNLTSQPNEAKTA